MGRVDIVTGTLGKALGGASGGYTCAKKEIIDLLRQRSRPYLFSNALAPAICAASLKVLEMLTTSTALRDKVHENTAFFRSELGKLRCAARHAPNSARYALRCPHCAGICRAHA